MQGQLVLHAPKKRKKQVCKPDSVLQVEGLSFIWDDRHRSPLAAYPPASGGPPSCAGILDISTREVYTAPLVTHWAVGSYPTFSPLSTNGGRFVFCCTVCPVQRRSFPLGSTVPFVVRTFLSQSGATSRPA